MSLKRKDGASNPRENQEANDMEHVFRGATAADDVLRTSHQHTGEVDEKFSWLGMSSLTSSPITNASGASLSAIEEAMRKQWQNISPKLNLDLIPIGKEGIGGLYVSSIVICAQFSNDETSPLAYHTLILESSIPPLAPQQIRVDGDDYEVLYFAADAYDSKMANVIRDVVQDRFPKAQDHYNASAEVVTRDVDLTDDETIVAVTTNAIKACRERLDEVNVNTGNLNLANALDDSYLVQNVRYGHSVTVDEFHHPVRGDVQMDVVAIPNNSKDNQHNVFGVAQVPISSLNGYIEFEWDAEHDPAARWGGNRSRWGQPQTSDLACYRANFVITRMTNERLQTLSATLMSLLSVCYLSNTKNWIQTLRPNHNTQSPIAAMHDIGHIGWDVDLTCGDEEYKKLVTTPDEFTDGDLYDLVETFFHPGLIISQDIGELAPDSYQYAAPALAAQGDMDAIDEIFDAAVTLTGGDRSNFMDIYQQKGGSGRPVICDENYTLQGYYNSDEGPRDIRDVDMRYICAALGPSGDHRAITEWIDTWNAASSLPEKRLAIRRQFYNNLLGDVTYTGRAIRITWEAAFLDALAECAARVGFVVRPNVPYMENKDFRRANARYGDNVILKGGAGSFFRNTSTFRGAGGGRSRDFSRGYGFRR